MKSMGTNILTINACTAALWPCTYAVAVPSISAILATQDNKVLRHSAAADRNAHLESQGTLKAIETATNLAFP